MKEIFVLYSIPKNSANVSGCDSDSVEGISVVLKIDTTLVPDSNSVIGGKQNLTTLTLLTIIVEDKIITVPSEMCKVVERDESTESGDFIL